VKFRTILFKYLHDTFIAWLLLGFVMFSHGVVFAQTVTNPGFESGTTGWTCDMEVNAASVYGGTGSDKVAEVDGHTNASSTADDRLLCQTITGFIVGAVYALEFDATRRASPSTPTTVSVTVSVAGALSAVVTRTGGWNMLRERLFFTATSTSHALRIKPDFTTSYGMLFDNFSVYVSSPLPIELVRFDAKPATNGVAIEWATASEHNNAGFEVQRSADLVVWESVSEVDGVGDGQLMNTYGTRDPSPLEGVSYYRLKQIDHDGTEAISEVRSVTYTPDRNTLLVWPNPASDQLTIRLDESDPSAQIFNALGQSMAIAQERIGSTVDLNIASLPAGSYCARTMGPQPKACWFIKQ